MSQIISKFLPFSLQKAWKFILLLVFSLILYGLYLPSHSISSFYTSRLRAQNHSRFSYHKFRDLSRLISTCEQLGTIDCLAYLDSNQTDYLEKLSSEENESFRKQFCTNENSMLFHTFWDSLNNLNDPLLLLHIQSHLYTQNRQCSRLIIWTLPSLYGGIDSRYNSHQPHLQFRTLLPVANELRDVGVTIDSIVSKVFGGPLFIRKAIISDAVRFVVLHKYGGMYIDADCLLLRDLQPLYMHEFAYRWSMLEEFNTAILRLYPQSKISGKLIGLAHEKRDPWKFFPTSIRKSLHPIILNRLPCAFFDPLWLASDNVDTKAKQIWYLTGDKDDRFNNAFDQHSEVSKRGRGVFNGAFIYHWHGFSFQMLQGSYLHQWKEHLERNLF